MRDNQDDTYAIRRAELDRQFQSLPPATTADYWRMIEQAPAEQSLPLEILGRCVRERLASGAIADAHRIFEAIAGRIQKSVQYWSGTVASKARSGVKTELRLELEQNCYTKVWEELATNAQTFLLEHFRFKLIRLCQHVAHDTMERSGEWQRRGVGTPKRIPSVQTGSLDAPVSGEGETPRGEHVADEHAQDALHQVELSDLLDHVMSLSDADRMIILDRFWAERPQAETAEKLGITTRALRYRLDSILDTLRARYHGTEEDNHA